MANTYTATLTAVVTDPNNALNSIWTGSILRNGTVIETATIPANAPDLSAVTAYAQARINCYKNQDAAAAIAAQIASSGAIALSVE